MLTRYCKRICSRKDVQAHIAMVKRDMEIARSSRNPLTIGYADYMN